MKMTELEIQKLLASYLDTREYPFRIVNGFIYNWESDFWAMSARGNTKEFEIKISYQDFKKDAEKQKHRLFDKQGPNYFYYVCPKDMISPKEIDPRYGLIYIFGPGYLEMKKKPKRLNDLQFDKWPMLAEKYYWKWYNLWRQKFIDKEITHTQFKEEFFLDVNDLKEK